MHLLAGESWIWQYYSSKTTIRSFLIQLEPLVQVKIMMICWLVMLETLSATLQLLSICNIINPYWPLILVELYELRPMHLTLYIFLFKVIVQKDQ